MSDSKERALGYILTKILFLLTSYGLSIWGLNYKGYVGLEVYIIGFTFVLIPISLFLFQTELTNAIANLVVENGIKTIEAIKQESALTNALSNEDNYISWFVRFSTSKITNSLKNSSLDCYNEIKDDFLLELINKDKIISWKGIDSMGESFWIQNDQNDAVNKELLKSCKNIERIFLLNAEPEALKCKISSQKDINKKYSAYYLKVAINEPKVDFGIATMSNGQKIVFTEDMESSNSTIRRGKIIRNKKEIDMYESKYDRYKSTPGVRCFS